MSQNRSLWKPTQSQKLEYVIFLHRIGALNEALAVLENVDGPRPERDYMRAKILIAQGEPEASRAALLSCLDAELTPVARARSLLTLASVELGLGSLDSAATAISESLSHATSLADEKFIARALILRARLAMERGDFAAARESFDAASGFIDVDRGRATLAALEKGSPESLRGARARSLVEGAHEGVRDIDTYALKARFDKADFEYLYFGSPSRGFRERLVREFGAAPAENYYVLGSSGAPCMDLRTGLISDSTIAPPPKGVLNVFDALLRDFYRPIRMGAFFEDAFRGEAFEMESASLRVRQAITRARIWLRENGIPAEIITENGATSLRLTGAFAFRVSLEKRLPERYAAELEILRENFRGSWGFSAREAREKLGLSGTTFKRFAAWALEAGHLERHGASSATFYRLPDAALGTAPRAA